ncbi:MAG: SDR family oxidoreductase [Gemmatimonadales bacterium]
MKKARTVFITGGTGFMGRALIGELHARGHAVRGLARPESRGRLPAGAVPVVGNALDPVTFQGAVAPADTMVHLVGAPNPGPWKAAEFRRIDLESLKAAVTAARHAGVRHFVYVSVAQPAPIMRSYIGVRQEAERMLQQSGLPATVLRPWYVLGPGRRWPIVLLPIYAVLGALPPTRAGARRLGLVTRDQMVAALVYAVENPASGYRVVEVPEIQLAAAGPVAG